MDNLIAELERDILAFPLMQYQFFKTEEIEFSKSVRYICEHECEHYGKSWACPPNVGTIDECVEECRNYTDCLIFSSVVEVSDNLNFEECLKAKDEHEEITYEIAKIFREKTPSPLVLSTGCTLCADCTYPDSACRFPERAFATIESHGIMLVPIAEKYGLSFDCVGNIVTYFSLIFFNKK